MNDPRPSSLNIAPGVVAEPWALRIQFSRGGGPGGQNVNKVNTKAQAWLNLAGLRGLNQQAAERLALLAAPYLTDGGEIHIACTVHRTQERNRQEVMEKLRDLILRAKVIPKKRRATRPSAASRRRRLEAKMRRGRIKADRRDCED